MNADGSHVIQITNNDTRETVPAWSPDGKAIVFVSEQSGNYEIYTVRIKE
jgi:TolB protein